MNKREVVVESVGIEALDERVDAMREALASIDDPVVVASLVDKVGRSMSKSTFGLTAMPRAEPRSIFTRPSVVPGLSRSRLYGLDL